MDIKDLMEKSRKSDLVSRFEESVNAHQKLMKEIGADFSIATRSLMDSALESAKELGPTIAALKDTAALSSITASIGFANLANESISKLSISSSIKEMMSESSKISPDWRKTFEAVMDYKPSASFESAIKGIQSQIGRISGISLLGENSLFKIDSKNIASLLSPTLTIRDSLIGRNLDFVDSYKVLFQSLSDKSVNYLSLAPAITTLPPIEFYQNNRFLETISIPIKESTAKARFNSELSAEAEDELEDLLNLLDPSLIKPWKGALAALNPRNPDAVRHFSISMRELLTTIIHKLSPDDKVKAWTNKAEHYHDNRPTRRARLLYICRNDNLAPFNTFLEKDIDTLLACNDIFQEGTHAIDAPLSTHILRELRNRVGSSIRLLIRIWKETNSN
jgi:hypothetical protein